MILARITLAAAVMAAGTGPAGASERPVKPQVTTAERIALLHRSYPDLIYSVTNNVLRLTNNRMVVIDDGRERDHLDLLEDGDIEDQLAQVYPLGKCFKGRKLDFDPGHIRSRAFLRLAYGANRHQVLRTATMIDWFGSEVRFSTRHGAADALRRVRDELRRLPAKLHSVLKRPTRTFDWTNAPDSDRLSVHAFAFSIDLNPAFRDHWQEHLGVEIGDVVGYRNRVPAEVIAVFERHGFIWGGKWHHFDTTHFEYRPAMIAIARLAEKRGCVGVTSPKRR